MSMHSESPVYEELSVPPPRAHVAQSFCGLLARSPRHARARHNILRSCCPDCPATAEPHHNLTIFGGRWRVYKAGKARHYQRLPSRLSRKRRRSLGVDVDSGPIWARQASQARQISLKCTSRKIQPQNRHRLMLHLLQWWRAATHSEWIAAYQAIPILPDTSYR